MTPKVAHSFTHTEIDGDRCMCWYDIVCVGVGDMYGLVCVCECETWLGCVIVVNCLSNEIVFVNVCDVLCWLCCCVSGRLCM